MNTDFCKINYLRIVIYKVKIYILTVIYFYRLSKLVEQKKIHILCKFKKIYSICIKIYSYFFFSLKINLSFLGMIDKLITWGWKIFWWYWVKCSYGAKSRDSWCCSYEIIFLVGSIFKFSNNLLLCTMFLHHNFFFLIHLKKIFLNVLKSILFKKK